MRLLNSLLALLAMLAIGAVMGGAASVALFATGAGLTVEPDAVTPSESGISGMQRLQAFQCVSGETKQIVTRGMEDSFAAVGEETISPGTLHIYMQDRFGRKGAVGVDRNYDDARLDQVLLDEIALPANTAEGLIVVRLRELSAQRNDTITLGDVINNARDGNAHVETFARITSDEPSPWRADGEVIYAPLSALRFDSETRTNHPADRYANLLAWVRSAEDMQTVQYAISEDTMVDFVGVAACLEPEEHRGTSFLVSALSGAPNHVRLSCSTADGISHCNPYIGDTACGVALPLACMREHNLSPPDLAPPGLIQAWTGADIAFSAPIPGHELASQEDAHAQCAAEFGVEWRMVNIHDGLMIDEILGRGSTTNVSQAWVDSKDQRYGNCWALTGTETDG